MPEISAEAIAKLKELGLNPGECEDCEDTDYHRENCPKCNVLICGHCWGHGHGFAAGTTEGLEGACEATDKAWRQAERKIARYMKERGNAPASMAH
jgi:hypothetical protein